MQSSRGPDGRSAQLRWGAPSLVRLVARVVPMPWFLSDDQGIDMYTSPRVLLIYIYIVVTGILWV